MTASGCDLLCICPHTDDAEIALGGWLHALSSRGRRVWVCDLTRGELASNATVDERWAEAARASEVLQLAGRVQLALPDGFLAPDRPEQAAAVIHVLRRLRPRWVVTGPEPRRHPDHLATPPLVARAVFLARLRALQPDLPEARWWPAPPAGETADQPWVVDTLAHTCLPDAAPDLLLDVSDSWEAKRRALACYASQFQRQDGRAATPINHPDFLARIDDRGRAWGRRAGVAHAEALSTAAVPVHTDLPPERWT